ncbi:D-alanyl-D-alanine carboxypeptidase family protein [Cohnella pontilimi]|uniref:D-alanyl-D-alanine carboxypeptidase family protein n=1 Tax=Cohnella pontilimi TaxID=2564100 RepID=UPI003CCC6249
MTTRGDRLKTKWLAFLLAAGLLLSLPVPAGAKAGPPPAPGNHAKAVSLIDVTSGRILFSQRGDEPMKIASLTKIMTAIVAIEYGKLDEMVTVSSRAAGKEGSSLYLQSGEKISLRNLLYGLMLRSGNDAAVAIAEHVGGSLDGFVYMMNRKAEELGLSHSHFTNPHGLDNPLHYMSANDLAKLTAYALHNPDFRAIVKTRVKTAPKEGEKWGYKWVNKNKMLDMYEGADGVKTGYTKQALRTLVSSATRGGQQLAAVTLNDRDDWEDHRKLLDYGFANYPLSDVVKQGEPIAGYPYAAADDFRYAFAKGELELVRMQIVPLNPSTLDYRLGHRGELRFSLQGQLIGSVPIVDLALPQQAMKSTAEYRTDSSVSHDAARSFADVFRSVIRALLLR